MAATGKSIKRAPFTATVSRPERRIAGRTWAAATPLALRTSGVAIEPALREHVHRRLGWRLGKFAPHIERVTIRFEDVNGPRRGRDTACRIKAVVAGLPSIIVTELAEDAQPRPSRKSKRGSVNRAKHGNKLARRQQRRLASPKGRRAQASGKT